MRTSSFGLPCLLLLSGALLGTACGVEEPEPSLEQVAHSEDEIINGSLDTTSRAVVWLYDENSGSSCTGTIIHVNGGTGYVLTAAHCNNMDFVVIANNYNDCFGQGNPNCEAVFQVAEQIYHPQYNPGNAGDGYDFSMIRFTGANGSTPVVPAATSPDGVSNGVQIDVVGYGQTQNGQNSQRRHKLTNIVNVYGNLFFEHLSTVCFGDSGGPAILNGKVIGVSSFVTDDACMASGFSGRVAPIYNSFIAPFIGGQTPPPTCQSCFDGAVAAGGACKGQYDTCIGNQQCLDYAGCVQTCTSQTCVDNCNSQNPAGSDVYSAIIDCACVSCASLCPECGGSSSSSSGAGGGSSGAGGSDGVDPDDDYVWYPGKQSKGNTVVEEGCSSSGQQSSGGLWLLGALALFAGRKRRA